MIQGMTGFAEKRFASDSVRLKVSIKSLNHRFFDWSYRGTPLGDVENRLRAACEKRLQRGRVEVNIDMSFLDPKSWDFAVNEALLEKALASLERVSVRLGKTFDLSLDQVLRIPQVIDISRKEITAAEAAFLEASFGLTLDEVVRQREKEGAQTVRQLGVHVRNIGRSTARIESLFRKQPALIRRKLRQRARDLNHGSRVSEERLAEETASLMQRYDLAEEILRLKSHIEALRELLAPGADGPVGKKLDFLAQEIGREANSSSTKSQEIGIIREGLAIKNELESIRQHA
ncbi:MAG TPA: DUF1732 domain-containing protein, partial [Acidobacteriota bacterium]|nr:DUF1732 domain-containing protein [Acidobacteriota bacterium]